MSDKGQLLLEWLAGLLLRSNFFDLYEQDMGDRVDRDKLSLYYYKSSITLFMLFNTHLIRDFQIAKLTKGDLTRSRKVAVANTAHRYGHSHDWVHY